MPYAYTKEEEEEEAADHVVSETRWAIQCARARSRGGNADEVVVTDEEVTHLLFSVLRRGEDEAQVRRILRGRGFAC